MRVIHVSSWESLRQKRAIRVGERTGVWRLLLFEQKPERIDRVKRLVFGRSAVRRERTAREPATRNGAGGGAGQRVDPTLARRPHGTIAPRYIYALSPRKTCHHATIALAQARPCASAASRSGGMVNPSGAPDAAKDDVLANELNGLLRHGELAEQRERVRKRRGHIHGCAACSGLTRTPPPRRAVAIRFSFSPVSVHCE